MNKTNRLLWFVLLSFLVTGYCRADFTADIPSASSNGLRIDYQVDSGNTTYNLHSIARVFDITAGGSVTDEVPAYQIDFEWDGGTYYIWIGITAANGDEDSVIEQHDASPQYAAASIRIPNAIPGHHYVIVVTSAYSYSGSISTQVIEPGTWQESLSWLGIGITWWIPSNY